MQKDRIISALIGLIGSCNNNPKTENTDTVIISSLAYPLLHPNCNDNALDGVINEIYAEKHIISPGCATCAMPCGNTSDYDMNRIYSANKEIQEIKLTIITELQELAAYICHYQKQKQLPSYDIEFFYKALSYLSYDMKAKDLSSLLKETQDLKQKIEETQGET